MGWTRTRLVAAAALVGIAAAASPGRAAQTTVLLGVHGGYLVGGNLDNVRYDPARAPVDLSLDDGFDFGADALLVVHPNIRLGLRFDRQNTDLQVRSGPRDAGFAVTADHVHGAVDFVFPHPGTLSPLLTLSLGSTFLRPESGRQGLDRFSWAMGIGAERAVSSRVALRAETRILAVFLDQSPDAFCGPDGDCYNYALSTWLWQGEGSLGLVVGF